MIKLIFKRILFTLIFTSLIYCSNNNDNSNKESSIDESENISSEIEELNNEVDNYNNLNDKGKEDFKIKLDNTMNKAIEEGIKIENELFTFVIPLLKNNTKTDEFKKLINDKLKENNIKKLEKNLQNLNLIYQKCKIEYKPTLNVDNNKIEEILNLIEKYPLQEQEILRNIIPGSKKSDVPDHIQQP